MRVKSEQHVLRVAETRNVSVVSQKHFRVSRFKFSPALQSFRGGLTGIHLGDILVGREANDAFSSATYTSQR